ncbi:MAG: hypothetical protein JW884_07090 [Deltaproteobacteria bacterium]|nr:hypothetical protein [Deltaproteobacteria bacterium]
MFRPVDLQINLLQSNSVERVHQVQQQHGDVQQRYFEDQLIREQKRIKETIQQSREAERKTVTDQYERRDSRSGREEQKNLDGKKASEDGREKIPGSDRADAVDIKV